MARKSGKDNYCVYVHINKINGKMYVGQSCDLHERWRCQGKNYIQCSKFFHAIKKYGWDNFIHAVIKDNLSLEGADITERELISVFDIIKNGYNIKDGGARGVLSPESLKKMGDAVHKAFTEHPEIKEKIRQKAIGRVVSNETRLKLSNNIRSARINIDGEVGSIRYWAKRIGMDHQPLLRRKNLHGLQYMVDYIKEKIKEREKMVQG
jgi:group I intron endonuclease